MTKEPQSNDSKEQSKDAAKPAVNETKPVADDAAKTGKTAEAAPADVKESAAAQDSGGKAVKGSPAKASKGKKRKVKAPSPHGKAYVQATFNNTLITFTDASGNVLSWGSPGVAGFKGTRKSTPYAATLASQAAAERAKQVGLQTVDVFVRGVGSGRDAAVRALQSSGLTITSIKDMTPMPHNGVRAKKPRRV